MDDFLQAAIAFWAGLPAWIQSAAVLTGGLLGALALRLLLVLILRLIRFNRLCERAGITEFLRKGGNAYAPDRLVGALVFWVMIIGLFVEASRLLGIEVVSQLWSRLLAAVPGLAAAGFILVGGWVILGFVANFAVTVARNAGSPHARLIGRLIRYSGLLLVLVLAVGQVEIGTGLFGMLLLVLFGALCLGLAIAVGLGCQHIVREQADRIVRSLREQARHGHADDLEG